MATSEAESVWSIARLLAWTRGHFEQRKLESPRLCAELLLAHALGCERIALYTRSDLVPDEAGIAKFRELVRQAAEGAPIAYLTGRKEFFSLSFEVSADVLIPRPETEILVERCIDIARKMGGEPRILDLCTGSGCIAVALAQHLPAASVSGSDVSAQALAVARHNAARHGLQTRVEFREGDLFDCWRGQSFDIVLCNPPYVALSAADTLAATVRDYEPHIALFAGSDGLATIRLILKLAGEHVRESGHLLLEIGLDQAPAVRSLLDEAAWSDMLVYKDAAQLERVVHLRRPPATARMNGVMP